MAKSICRHHYAERMSDEQKRLLECSEKDIGKYHADVPKGHGCNHKQWAKEGQTRVEALLRL